MNIWEKIEHNKELTEQYQGGKISYEDYKRSWKEIDDKQYKEAVRKSQKRNAAIRSRMAERYILPSLQKPAEAKAPAPSPAQLQAGDKVTITQDNKSYTGSVFETPGGSKIAVGVRSPSLLEIAKPSPTQKSNLPPGYLPVVPSNPVTRAAVGNPIAAATQNITGVKYYYTGEMISTPKPAAAPPGVMPNMISSGSNFKKTNLAERIITDIKTGVSPSESLNREMDSFSYDLSEKAIKTDNKALSFGYSAARTGLISLTYPYTNPKETLALISIGALYTGAPGFLASKFPAAAPVISEVVAGVGSIGGALFIPSVAKGISETSDIPKYTGEKLAQVGLLSIGSMAGLGVIPKPKVEIISSKITGREIKEQPFRSEKIKIDSESIATIKYKLNGKTLKNDFTISAKSSLEPTGYRSNQLISQGDLKVLNLKSMDTAGGRSYYFPEVTKSGSEGYGFYNTGKNTYSLFAKNNMLSSEPNVIQQTSLSNMGKGITSLARTRSQEIYIKDIFTGKPVTYRYSAKTTLESGATSINIYSNQGGSGSFFKNSEIGQLDFITISSNKVGSMGSGSISSSFRSPGGSGSGLKSFSIGKIQRSVSITKVIPGDVIKGSVLSSEKQGVNLAVNMIKGSTKQANIPILTQSLGSLGLIQFAAPKMQQIAATRQQPITMTKTAQIVQVMPPIQIPRVSSITRAQSITKVTNMLDLARLQLPALSLRSSPKLAQTQRVTQLQEVITNPVVTTRAVAIVTIPTNIIPPVMPPVMPPLDLGFRFGSRRVRAGKISQKTQYKPNLRSLVFNIKGKMPKVITPFSNRPILRGG